LACFYKWKVESRGFYDKTSLLRAGVKLGLSRKTGEFRFLSDGDDADDDEDDIDGGFQSKTIVGR